jgi:hypothetical protein
VLRVAQACQAEDGPPAMQSAWRSANLFDLGDDRFQVIAFGAMKGVFRVSRFVGLNHDKYHWLVALGTHRTIDRFWDHHDATPSAGGSASGLSATGARG